MNEQEILTNIKEIIKNETGIIIEKERSIDLEIVIHSRLIFHNMKPEQYIKFIEKNYNEIIFVASCFTIQETSFYRYKGHFDRLKLEIIPEIIQNAKATGNKAIKILSAGCATGEEPYTISMIINDLIPNFKGWDIKIYATDINENALKIAKEGIYSEYKLRNIEASYIKKYFTKIQKDKKSKIYKLNDSIINSVEFKHCNLIKEPFELSDLNDADIIFCENVIIYFCIDSIERLINNFFNILKNDGYLFLGYSETLNFIKHKFNLSWWNDSYIYKKSEQIDEIPEYDMRKIITFNDKEPEKTSNNVIKTYDDIINMVIHNYNEELFDNVATLLKKIEKSEMELDEIFYIIKAEFKYDKKDYIDSTNECRKAININPHSIDAHIILAAIYLELNMLDSASFEIKTALYIDSASILANYYFALFNKKIENEQEYLKHLKISHKILDENKGILRTRLYPINKNTRKEIYDNIIKFKN